MTNEMQKAEIEFCEEVLYITFEGDIEDAYEVKLFLSLYLDEARERYNELRCEYEIYIWNLDD